MGFCYGAALQAAHADPRCFSVSQFHSLQTDLWLTPSLSLSLLIQQKASRSTHPSPAHSSGIKSPRPRHGQPLCPTGARRQRATGQPPRATQRSAVVWAPLGRSQPSRPLPAGLRVRAHIFPSYLILSANLQFMILQVYRQYCKTRESIRFFFFPPLPYYKPEILEHDSGSSVNSISKQPNPQ